MDNGQRLVGLWGYFPIRQKQDQCQGLRIILEAMKIPLGFPGGVVGKEPLCRYRKHKTLEFDPWTRKILWRRIRQPTPVCLPGESPWTEKPVGL